MATTAMTARECSKCLDELCNPVVTSLRQAVRPILTFIPSYLHPDVLYSHESGHLICHPCMKMQARRSNDPYQATCPTCRSPFSIGGGLYIRFHGRLSLTWASQGYCSDAILCPSYSVHHPKEMPSFVSPSLCRVFLGDGEDSSQESIEKLNTEVATLKARVKALKRDKDRPLDGSLRSGAERARAPHLGRARRAPGV